MTWHFFVTSHGKCAVDGIGGIVKRECWLAVLSGAQLENAKDFCDIVQQTSGKINVIQVTKERVMQNQKALDERWNDIARTPKLKKCIVQNP